MDESQLTRDELIIGMAPDELCEVLAELGIASSEGQAAAIQQLVQQLGSLEAALGALGGEDVERRAA